MPAPTADALPSFRRPAWKWWVCGLLLLATMLNYMDRLTLNQTARRIKAEFALNNEQYGQIESAFAVAFALGALVAGWLADRWNVRGLYPVAVLAWSLAGFATGFVVSFPGLLACRSFLGFTEAGHWPCALRTTQHILPREQRTLGNGILQSGAAVGAVITPLVVVAFLHWTDSWRYPFLVVGGLGLFWVALWLALVRRADLHTPAAAPAPRGGPPAPGRHDSLAGVLADRRFWVLIVVVIGINIAWHYFRAWMPLFLQEAHGYGEAEANFFTAAYYLATDAGSLAAGLVTLWLARRLTVHRSRMLVFLACSLLTTLSLAAANLPRGPLLLAVLLVIGFAALGLFPNYYSFSQELTVRHQGKVTGLLGCSNWLAMALLHWLVGRSIDQTKSYSLGLGLAGLAPLVAFAALLLFWGRGPAPEQAARHGAAEREAGPPDERIRPDARGVGRA
jgi:ACS family hexuronate transporter-like MFS transporter